MAKKSIMLTLDSKLIEQARKTAKEVYGLDSLSAYVTILLTKEENKKSQ